MNKNLLSIVKQITSQYGEDILEDPKRLKSFFSDLAKDEPKTERIAFGRCVEKGAYRILKNTATAKERRQVIDSLALRIREEEGLDLTLCTDALELFAAALFGEGAALRSAPAAAPPSPVMPAPVRETAFTADAPHVQPQGPLQEADRPLLIVKPWKIATLVLAAMGVLFFVLGVSSENETLMFIGTFCFLFLFVPAPYWFANKRENGFRALFNRGNDHYNRGLYDEAIAGYCDRIKKGLFTPAYNNRGNAYYQKGLYDEAIADYCLCLKNQALILDTILKDRKHFNQAIYSAVAAVSAAAYNNRGNAYFQKGMYDPAVEDYTAALQIDPNHHLARQNIELMRRARGY